MCVLAPWLQGAWLPAPWPGMEPPPSTLEGEALNTRAPERSEKAPSTFSENEMLGWYIIKQRLNSTYQKQSLMDKK